MTSPMTRNSNLRRLLTFSLVPLLAGTLAVLWWRQDRVVTTPDPSRRVAPATVSRTNLILVSGRLCLVGQEQERPFSGVMVEHAADGALRSRSAVENGLLHGLSQGWHTNGRLQVAEHFREGISHGVRTKWYANGLKLSEGEIVDGEFHGTFRRWSESGSLAKEIEFVRGRPHGTALAYFESGYVQTWARVEEGTVKERKSWNDREQKEILSD